MDLICPDMTDWGSGCDALEATLRDSWLQQPVNGLVERPLSEPMAIDHIYTIQWLVIAVLCNIQHNSRPRHT